ncbi:MAG TPA: S1 RNA-binding domain-containing protein [Oceanobacillus sp.]|nr:S1 RNA-binding domain-containing protein [Oceanobacillus sp.]
MTTNVQRWDHTPPQPPVDEGYWAALLKEGEFSEAAPAASDVSIQEDRHYIDETAEAFPFTNEPRDNNQQSDWETMRRIMNDDETVELQVVGFNRGGLLVEWNSLRGFVPASQLVDFPATSNGIVRRKLLGERIGETLSLRVIELNEEQNRLILSERAARALPGERADLLTRLRVGDTCSGHITNLCEFGAFVDLGGVEGLIHISELSWGRVGHPSDILTRGQFVEVYVLDVNKDAGRIALSLKRLHPDPWETVHERYHIGETVTGVITNVVDFGAFARIEEGLEGLIHVSELAEGHFLHPRNVVQEGQEITARILSIDGRARRLGLTLRSTT